MVPVILVIIAVVYFLSQSQDKITENISSLSEDDREYRNYDTFTKVDSISIPVFHPDVMEENYPSPEIPWIALIIDDFGPYGSAALVDGFLKLPLEITFAVIPGYPKTEAIGKKVVEAGHELFIHMPMEPTKPVAMDEKYMLLVQNSLEDVTDMFNKAMLELPGASGVNNHMGSKATNNDTLMLKLAEVLKSRNLVFIDSRTVPRSRALPAMRKKGVAALGRDVFIDNEKDTLYIENQLDELVRIAERRGWAIGIGHANPATLSVLNDFITKRDLSYITFIRASNLIKSVQDMRIKQAEFAGLPVKRNPNPLDGE